MAYNWETASFDYEPSTGNNAYVSNSPSYGVNTDNSSSNNAAQNSQWYNAATGVGGYQSGQQSGSATGGAISGAASGYQSGGWVGAVVGGISGWYGGKESEEKEKKGKLSFEQQMELQLANAKYAEEIRQKKNKETTDALSMYTAKTPPAATFNYTNGLMGGMQQGAFAPQPAQQPYVNPETNGYGLLRG